MSKGFVNAETILSANQRTVRPSLEFYEKIESTSGSFNIFPARLFGLSPANYLRLVRDRYGAVLQGRQGGYITYYFEDSKKCDMLVSELNRRWAIFEKEMGL